MEGFLQKRKSMYHVITEKCQKNNNKVKRYVYAFPVVYTTVKLVRQLQVVCRLVHVLCIAHCCDGNKRNMVPVCTFYICCKHTNNHRIHGFMSKIIQKSDEKCLLGLIDFRSTMEKGIDWTSWCYSSIYTCMLDSGWASQSWSILVCIAIGRQ